MNTHADQTQENISHSVSAADSQMQTSGESTFQVVDNRPEAVAQRKLQEMANSSPKVSKLRAFQDMANNSSQSKLASQLQATANSNSTLQSIQKKENNTGLPDNLKTGMENLSGMSLDDVRVHRNSNKPAQLQAHAYAQVSDIHLGSGQEKHLPHEAWHVVQQKQGRVKPTMQMKGKVNINDDAGLEKEADIMGEMAMKPLQFKAADHVIKPQSRQVDEVVQRELKAGELNVVGEDHEESDDRRQAEEKFCSDEVPGGYWVENTFPASAETENPADTLLLQARFQLSVAMEKNIEICDSWSTTESDGDIELTDATEKDLATMQETFEEIIDLVKREPDREKADPWWQSNGNEINRLEALFTNPGTDENPAIQARQILDGMQLPTVKEVSFERSAAMHLAAKKQKDTPGVWKIGDAHVKDIRAIRDKERIPSYNLLSQAQFNREFDQWVPPAPPPSP